MKPIPVSKINSKHTVIGLFAIALSGCGYDAYSVRGFNPGPDYENAIVRRCSLLLEVEIKVWSDFDGMLLPDAAGSASVSSALLELFASEYEQRSGRQLRRVRQPVANPGLLNEYLSLYRLVTDQALLRAGSSDPGWQYQQGRTDLGVGPGLHQVAGVTLCDTAIVLNGFQLPASGSDAFPGLPAGRAVITLGMLDLVGGEIIRVNQVVLPAGRDFRQAENLQIAIERVLRDFPV